MCVDNTTVYEREKERTNKGIVQVQYLMSYDLSTPDIMISHNIEQQTTSTFLLFEYQKMHLLCLKDASKGISEFY